MRSKGHYFPPIKMNSKKAALRLSKYKIPDKKIVHTWELFYDKYSALMYGTILHATGDMEISELILIEAFIDLTNHKSFMEWQDSDVSKFVFLYSKMYTKYYMGIVAENAITPLSIS